ncbi:MAG TPA: glycine oxidase ThiO, partial [Proteobacteria bacterium]|nr:glycine oxidase ThiO [Pseudomonadota bacterium]
ATTVAGELAAGHFVLAAGAWSQTVAAALGLTLEVVPVKGQILLLRAPPGTVQRIVKHASA